jgi:hypothetical protein
MTKLVSIEVKFAQVAQALARDALVTLNRTDLPKIYQICGLRHLSVLRGQTTREANLPYISSTYESTIGLSREGISIA